MHVSGASRIWAAASEGATKAAEDLSKQILTSRLYRLDAWLRLEKTDIIDMDIPKVIP